PLGAAPGRAAAAPARAAAPAEVPAAPPGRARRRRTRFPRRHHLPQAAEIHRIHENVVELGIVAHAAPVGSAYGRGEMERRLKQERLVRAVVLPIAEQWAAE